MGDRDTIRVALIDAIDWNVSLVEAYRDGFTGKVIDDPSVARARELVKRFQSLLKRRYGGEPVDPTAGAKLVSIFALIEAPKTEEDSNK